MTTPESSRSLSVPSRITYQFALLSLCLFAPVLSCSVSAQSLPPRPVARLIPGRAELTRYSRPRRVAPGANVTNSPTSTSINDANENERRAFAATNEVRAKNGFPPLSWDSELARMARAHSEKMARGGFFGHDTPAGLRLKDRARAAGIRHFKVLGENIAYNQGVDDPGAFAVQRWMISSVHRANILSREFRAAGIGSFVTRDGRVYLTQIFISR